MNGDPVSVWLGFDPREADAFAVARTSLRRTAPCCVRARGLVLDELRRVALYTRPVERRAGRLWDPISDAPMSTEFALSRFLVPHLQHEGWALFCDCDVLFRRDVMALFALADPRFAVQLVKHDHRPAEGVKMDGQVQTAYPRKNWSSVCLWNCGHEANRRLTLDVVNTTPGRDLHAFCWLADEEIGGLPVEWNFLVGHYDPAIRDPALVHFTDGVPSMPGYEDQPFAGEWRRELARWAA